MGTSKIVICDTNIIIEFFKHNTGIVNELEIIGEQSIFVSFITVGELYYGALNKNELNKIKKKISSIVNIPITEPISNLFLELMIDYSLSHKLSIPDAIIAATALYYDVELYTLNKKDFKYIKGLKLYETRN